MMIDSTRRDRLSTVASELSNDSYLPFNLYFQQYVSCIQDQFISRSLEFVDTDNNWSDICSIMRDLQDILNEY